MTQDASRFSTKPVGEAETRTLPLKENGGVPNNPQLPVVLMRSAVSPDAGAAAIRRLMEGNGWGGTWQYTVFDFHHFHPNAHETLVVASGEAALVLGGEGGEEVRVNAGDVLVLPAGTGHFRADASPDFLVCGAYPRGQEDYETLRADEPWPEGLAGKIAGVPLPASDPVYGSSGPLTKAWGYSPLD